MVKKFNLSEAAADILSKSVSGAMSKRTDGPSRLPVSVVAGQKEVGEIGTNVTKTTDAGPDATKGVATATPPGATPPVGSEPAKKLSGQPAEQGSVEAPEGKPGTQKMEKNKGATFQSYGQKNEDEELDGEVVAEAEDKEGHEDEKKDKAMMKKMMAKKDLKEDIDALLQGQDLSEEFVSKATTIFEAAVMSRVEEIAEEVEAQLHEQFEVAVEELKEDFATKIDEYLNYMVEEWMKDNEIAIQSGLKAEITEEFLTGLRDLFIEHNIDIPEDKVDIVEELAAQLEATEAVLNEEIARGIELSQALNEQKKIEAIYTACEGLTQTQVEKMKSLAEGVDFTTGEEFTTKLDTLKESYFKADVKVATTDALDDEVLLEEEKRAIKSSNSEIDFYAKTISQTLVK
jgi:hypothetical protein